MKTVVWTDRSGFLEASCICFVGLHVKRCVLSVGRGSSVMLALSLHHESVYKRWMQALGFESEARVEEVQKSAMPQMATRGG